MSSERAAQDCIQSGLKLLYLQRGRLLNFSGQLIPLTNCPHHDKASPCIQAEPLVSAACCLPTSCRVSLKSHTRLLDHLIVDTGVLPLGPLAPNLSRLTKPSSFSLFSQASAPTSVPCWLSAELAPVHLCLLLCCGAQNQAYCSGCCLRSAE